MSFQRKETYYYNSIYKYLLIGAGGGGAGGKTIGGGTGGAGAKLPAGERLTGGAPEPEYSGRGSCRYFILIRSL